MLVVDCCMGSGGEMGQGVGGKGRRNSLGGGGLGGTYAGGRGMEKEAHGSEDRRQL